MMAMIRPRLRELYLSPMFSLDMVRTISLGSVRPRNVPIVVVSAGYGNVIDIILRAVAFCA